MEYCSGGDCFSLLEMNGSLSEQFVVHVMSQLLVVLTHLHEHSILHLDIKPDNVRPPFLFFCFFYIYKFCFVVCCLYK